MGNACNGVGKINLALLAGVSFDDLGDKEDLNDQGIFSGSVGLIGSPNF